MSNVVLEIKNLSKKFPGVQALNKVNFKLHRGEIHALVGENGAGKSTLINILSGVIKEDDGEIYLFDNKVKIENPLEARKLGIGSVFQELNVIPQMNIAENIFLGHEPKKYKIFVDKKQLYNNSKKELKRIGYDLDPFKKVSMLTISERQMVEIVKNFSFDIRIFILDEPTSSLSLEEVTKLFHILKVLKEEGISIIFVSHEMNEIFEIADKITVLRNGENVLTIEKEKITKNELINVMAGREIDFSIFSKDKSLKKYRNIQNILFKIEGLKNKKINMEISFSLYRGEVLSILGILGSGKTELVRAIFGLDNIESGKIFLNNKKLEINTPLKAIQNGLGYVTEDRREDGLIPILSVRDNMVLVVLKKLAKMFGFRNKIEEEKLVADFKRKLAIKFSDMNQKVLTLSGGNQQKVVLSKWLASKIKVLLLDEPTRGVDVSTRQQLYSILRDIANNNNTGIIILTSDILEAITVSNRILIIRKGEIISEILPEEMDYNSILNIMIGGKITGEK